MTLKIGQKIKELREKRNITQNKMAEYLGITEQAISRWENGGGYPDMELIPAISNFLDVSTDILFETDKKEERRRSLLNEAWKTYDYGTHTVSKRIEIYRNVLKEFPNDYATMDSLISNLLHDFPRDKHLEEIIALSNRIISDSPDIQLRMSATDSLAKAYKDIGKQESAVKIIKESNIIIPLQLGIGYSRENLLSIIAEGEEAWQNRKDMLQILFNELCTYVRYFSIQKYGHAIHPDGEGISDISNEEWFEMIRLGISVHEKIGKIIEAFYEDGDYGWLREGMVYLYIELAEYYMILGEYDRALDNIEKCAETAIAFDTDKTGRHTSILVKDLKKHGDFPLCNYRNHSENIRYNQSYRLIHDWLLGDEPEVMIPIGEKRERVSGHALYVPIRETERFKAVIANLEKYAKIENE